MLGDGGIEVVSAELFQQQKLAMDDTSPCSQCQRQRAAHTARSKRQRYKRSSTSSTSSSSSMSSSSKCGSPVVVRIKESIRRKLKPGSPAVSDLEDWEVSSSDDGSTHKHMQSRSRPHAPTRTTALHTPSDNKRLLQQQQRSKLTSNKNLSAFLSAVEKAHMKEVCGHRNNLADFTSPQLTATPNKQLNNALVDCHLRGASSEGVADKKRSLGLLEGNNVELICNDLHGDSAMSCCSSDLSESDTVSSSASSPTSCLESDDEDDEEDKGLTSGALGQDELAQLTAFTSGFPVTRYHCGPHECPQCLASCSLYQPPSCYTQESNRASPPHASSTDAATSLTATTTSSTDAADVKSSHVMVTAPGKVDISLSTFHHNQAISAKTTAIPSKELDSPIDSVYVDLTHTDVTYTIETGGSSSCSEAGPVSWVAAYPHLMYYQAYSTMLGSSVCGAVGGFFYTACPPSYGFTYPATSPIPMVPRPLALPRCVNPHTPCSALRSPANACHTHPMIDHRHFTTSQPPQRPWLPIAHPETNRPIAIYTVMCYNVLCDKYATRQLYGYCPSWALNWEYRKKIILEEIRQYSADIITLQEVETEQFYNFFLPELKLDGYDGIFSPKSRARTMIESERKHVDGCAIFFRTSKFSLIKEHLVEFNQLAIVTAEGSHDMINRVMTKDNIGLAALLETKEAIWENGMPAEAQVCQPILVATCHVHWDPEFSDVKLIQTMLLVNELKNIIEETQTSLRPGSTGAPDSNSTPLLLCGDLNSLPDSGVVEYLTLGRVDANHKDFRDLSYEDSLRKLSHDAHKDIFAHGFKLAQAYTKDVMPYTNYTFDFKGIIDYIFYSKDFMRPLGLLGPLDQEWFRENKVFGCPHPQIPSDHLPLLVEFEMGQCMSSPSSGATASTPQQQQPNREPDRAVGARTGGGTLHNLTSRR